MNGRAVFVNAAVEGLHDAAVAIRVLEHTGLRLGQLQGQRGKDWLDRNLRAFNNAAQRQPWLVLRDLDHDEPCASALIERLLPRCFDGLRLRICVRAIDAWLLADHEHLSTFLQVPAAAVPAQPELLPDPKREMIALARRSRSAGIRADLLPRSGSFASVGPAYTQRLRDFVADRWQPDRAAHRSPSLARCLSALRDLRRRFAPARRG